MKRICEVMPLKLTAKLICGFPNLWPIQFLLPGHYYSIDQIFLTSLSTSFPSVWLMVRWLDVTHTLRWTFRLTSLGKEQTGGSCLPAGAEHYEKTKSGNSCCFPRQQQAVLENLRWLSGSNSPHNSTGPTRYPRALCKLLAHEVEG